MPGFWEVWLHTSLKSWIGQEYTSSEPNVKSVLQFLFNNIKSHLPTVPIRKMKEKFPEERFIIAPDAQKQDLKNQTN